MNKKFVLKFWIFFTFDRRLKQSSNHWLDHKKHLFADKIVANNSTIDVLVLSSTSRSKWQLNKKHRFGRNCVPTTVDMSSSQSSSAQPLFACSTRCNSRHPFEELSQGQQLCTSMCPLLSVPSLKPKTRIATNFSIWLWLPSLEECHHFSPLSYLCHTLS